MPEERQTKNQRREAAREAARLEREKQKKRDRLRRWLIPSVSTVAVLAIAAGIVWAFLSNQPAPQSSVGPRNMISDGILFTGQDGELVPVETGAIQPSGEPTPTDLEEDGLAHIVTYVDFSCPACQGFEATYAESIQSLVGQGLATLEVHPIAILDSRYAGSRYSSRSNNVRRVRRRPGARELPRRDGRDVRRTSPWRARPVCQTTRSSTSSTAPAWSMRMSTRASRTSCSAPGSPPPPSGPRATAT